MSNFPRIFLCFANNEKGTFLKALLPEKNALQKTLRKYEKQNWGSFFTAATSEPESLLLDLNNYSGEIIIFHFSGHNEGKNLQFVDEAGNPLAFKDSALKAFLQSEKRLQLVFLNACATQHHIHALQSAGIPAIIATSQAVGDKQAKKFSHAFYDSLVAGNRLEEAFGKACAVLGLSKEARGKHRGFVFEEDDSQRPAWELLVLKEEMLDWKLKEEARKSGLAVKDTQPLNLLPGPPMDFVGREKDLEDLEKQLIKEEAVLLLNGLGGIGKTTLARQYLYENYHQFDNILWVSVLSDQKEKELSFETATEALGNDVELLKALNIPFKIEESSTARAKEVLKALKSQKGKNLLIIDNAGFSLEAIRRDLPQPPHWQVLITSRKELPGLSIKKLDELPPEEALELFYLHYPQGKAEAGEVEALLKHIAYHTLTLELFAKSCKKSPSTNPKKILNLIREKRLERLSRKVFSEHSNREVEVYSYLLAAFELHELSEGELSILIQWAILPAQEIPWEVLCQLYGIEEGEEEKLEAFEDSIISLQEKGWIEQGVGGKGYRMHQLIQEILRYKHPPTKEICKEVIQGVKNLIYVEVSKDNPIEKFPFVIYGESVLEHIEQGDVALANLQNDLALRYKDLGFFDKAKELSEIVLETYLQRLGENHAWTAIVRSNLATVYQDLGEYGKAVDLLEVALASDLKNHGKDHPNTARSRSNLAVVYRNLGKYEKAADLLELALSSDLKSFGEDHPNTARSRSNLALVYRNLGEYKKAADLLELALSSDLKSFGEDHPSTAISRSNLATVYQNLGEYKKAAGLLELALSSDLKNFGKDHPSTARSRSNLALVYQDLGEYEQAIDLLIKAMGVFAGILRPDHPHTRTVAANLRQALEKGVEAGNAYAREVKKKWESKNDSED